MYQDEHGAISDREICGTHVFPVCKRCHSKSNPSGVHGARNWVTGRGSANRNTDAALQRLKLGYKLLSNGQSYAVRRSPSGI
jgi:hypothetical protein